MSTEPGPRSEGGAPADLRIALISSSYAPAIGGVEETVRRLASGLQVTGHPVEVWTVDREGGSSVATVDGVTVRYLPTPLPAKSVGAIARFAMAGPRAWRQWTRAVRAFRPTVLHVHCFGPNGLYALAVHRRFGIPLFLTSHGETIADDRGVFGRSALLRRALRAAVTRAIAVTGPSSVVLDDLRAHYGLREGTMIPNGVDLTVPARPSRASPPYVFAVGRLGHMKGFDLLVQAFEEAALDPSVRLVIGGDGPERGPLEELVASSGLGSRVELRGWMPPQAVADAMAGALAVAVPSRMEAFGLVALEAWRSGAALIMTERGGARGFVTDGVDGLLVDPQDVTAFAAVLRRVVEDPLLRQGLADAGRIRVLDFGWGDVVARYERLYSNADALRKDAA